MVLSFYRGSWIEALSNLFPSLLFDESKILHYPSMFFLISLSYLLFILGIDQFF